MSLASPRSLAFPDGAPWEAAGQEGCTQCHFDAPVEDPSDALSIIGLPDEIAPGGRYPLTVRLEDDGLRTAGFLLSASQAEDDGSPSAAPAGAFETDGARAAANGAQARSTEAGLLPDMPNLAEWSLVWTAPAPLEASVVLELWANAGNDDKSPFGDATHRRVFLLQHKGSAGL